MEAQPDALAAAETASLLTDEAGSAAAGMVEEQEGGDAGLQPIVDDLLHATVAAGTCALVACSLTHACQGPVVVLEGGLLRWQHAQHTNCIACGKCCCV